MGPAPVDGAANEALIRILAAALDVPRSAVSIRSGARSRDKLLAVEGIAEEEVRRRWPGLDQPRRGRAR